LVKTLAAISLGTVTSHLGGLPERRLFVVATLCSNVALRGNRRGYGTPATNDKRLEKLHHLTTTKLLPDSDLLGRVDAVDLEHVLGGVSSLARQARDPVPKLFHSDELVLRHKLIVFQPVPGRRLWILLLCCGQ
jgi:hypothetical protein